MRIEFYYGAVPYEVEPTQLGTSDYPRRGRAECAIYRAQLERCITAKFGSVPGGLSLQVKGENHDFGTYYEVQGRCHEDDEEAMTAAFWLDENCPGEWDEIAADEIAQLG